MDSKVCQDNLLLDIGGTFIKGGIASSDEVLDEDSFFSTLIDSSGSKEDIAKALTEAVGRGYDYASKAGIRIGGIGIAIPGPFDYDNGIPLMKHKFASVFGLPMKDIIRSGGIVPEDVPIMFMHDVASMLSGEMSHGNGMGYKNIALISLGTGLGFTYCINGEIQYSPTKSPLIPIYNLPYRDGILEDYVSKRGFLKNYSIITGKPAPEGLTVKELGKMAEEGDVKAVETFSMVGDIIANSISPILRKYGIECLLLGGQISKSFKYMGKSLSRLLPSQSADVKDIDGIGVPTLEKVAPAAHIGEATFYGLCSLLRKSNP